MDSSFAPAFKTIGRVVNHKSTNSIPTLSLKKPAAISDIDRIAEIKISQSFDERVAAFKLVHDVYCRAGLSVAGATGMRVMKHHLLDTSDVMIARRGPDVCFTASLIRDGEFGLPSESSFPDEIREMRLRGIQLAEVSCVASNHSKMSKKERIETLIGMMTLIVHVSRRRSVERVLLAVHPRHAKVYHRLFGCVPWTAEKPYAAVRGNPAVLCVHDFEELDRRRYSLYDQIYASSYHPWELDGARMTDAEKAFFANSVQEGLYEPVEIAA